MAIEHSTHGRIQQTAPKEALCVWAEGPPCLPSPFSGWDDPPGAPWHHPTFGKRGGGVKSGPPSWYFLFVGCFKRGDALSDRDGKSWKKEGEGNGIPLFILQLGSCSQNFYSVLEQKTASDD
ncbi:hypothetical protein CEXT_690421 [Caerostris extrusa]|uniref:Uncharacterized protein n=1 Tax=Caerostris extrusa TaxID=172846 RepID=A0AAV4MKS4_CAEEX|nr:hypothetical protein CEXT_690421 [Caerostris extrusa]